MVAFVTKHKMKDKEKAYGVQPIGHMFRSVLSVNIHQLFINKNRNVAAKSD